MAAMSQGRGVSNTVEGYYIQNGRTYYPAYIHKDDELMLSERVMVFPGLTNKEVVFTPDRIEGFGMGGKHYVSAKVTYNGFEYDHFLEEVITVGDSFTVYFHFRQHPDKHMFYIVGNDGEFRDAIPYDAPQPLWDMILANTDCGNTGRFKPFPEKATRAEVVRYYEAYRRCNPNLFPRFEFGIQAGVGAFNPGRTGTMKKFGYDLGYYVGLYASIPLNECFSFRPEVNFFINDYNNGTWLNVIDGNWDDIDYLRKSLQVPLLFRYSFNYLSGRVIPYVELGPTLDFTMHYKPLTNWNPSIDKSSYYIMGGGTLGAGVEWKLSYRRSLYTGLRFDYVRQFDRSADNRYANFSFNAAFTIFGK